MYNGPQILAEYVSGALVRKFIYGPGIDEPLAMIIPSGDYAGTYWYFYDGLGSVVALVNGTTGAIVERYIYDAFGNTAVCDGQWNPRTPNASLYGNPFMFTGRQYDPETGLYYYRARMYSPALGRFLQTDPIGYADSMNLYAYCGNNPINWIDPYGLCKGSGWDWFQGGLDVIGLFDPTIITDGINALIHLLRGNYGDAGASGLAMAPFIGDFFGKGIKYGGKVLKHGDEAGKIVRKGIPKPSVTDPKLNNLVEDLYKGTKTPNQIGMGSTADAIRNELKTGQATYGRFHSQKGQEYVRALEKWLQKNPNASAADRAAAQQMLDDLNSALAGK